MLDSCKRLQNSLKHSIRFYCVFPSLKQQFIAYHVHIAFLNFTSSDKLSRVYSNSCCSCSLEPEIIKIGQSSHRMYSNTIQNFQESTTILNACTKKSGNLLKHHIIKISCSGLKNTNLMQHFLYVGLVE